MSISTFCQHVTMAEATRVIYVWSCQSRVARPLFLLFHLPNMNSFLSKCKRRKSGLATRDYGLASNISENVCHEQCVVRAGVMKILRVNNLSTCVTQARKCLVYTAYHYCTCDCTHVQYSVCFCYKWHLWCYISNPLIICKSLLRYHIFGDEVESFLLWQPLGKLMNLT